MTSNVPTSPGLLKAARTGVARSRTATPAALADTSALDAVFGAGAPALPVAESPAPVNHPHAEEATSRQVDGASDLFGRMTQRFGAREGERPAAASAPRDESANPTGASGTSTSASTLIDRMVKVADNGDGSLKKAMAGAKVLTPLVAAMSFAPGSERPGGERSAALTTTLVQTLRAAEGISAEYERVAGKPVPQWIRTQLMTAIAEQIAKRIEKQRAPLSEGQMASFIEGLELISREHAGVLAQVVENACNDAYQPCVTKNDARDRLSVTLASCAWKMYDWVTHDCLSMDKRGEHPSRFFSYGLEVDNIVQELLRAAVDQASAFVVNPNDPDLRIAHLQNSINRFTNLIGSEYVTRTRAIMNRIGENGLSPREVNERSRQACDRFGTETLPRILEYARSVFVYIENGAAQVADGFYDQLLNEPINAPHAAGR
jgi:hypothetical protein